MFLFLLPLLTGFLFAGASVFTSAYSRRWGERGGQLATNLLRNFLGIPLYMLGLVLAWRTDVPLLFVPGMTGRGLGWLLVAAGIVPIVVGHLQLGWRTHLPSVGDALMDGGLYAYVRHPIYAGGVLMFAGLMLLRPSVPWLLACLFSGVFFTLMGGMEERDLLQRMPAYREYMERVPRFIPFGMQRWAWICPLLGVAMAAAVFYLWGLSWRTAILAALTLACPTTILWGLVTLRRYPKLPQGEGKDILCCHQPDEKGERHDR
jgi:protein-S-isoprenylcysteine O-methyltransferase Ste14